MDLDEARRIVDAPRAPTRMTAWHCGSRKPPQTFSAAYLGTGERYRKPPLGPGFYFHTVQRIARRYCKYVDQPWTTKVSIDMSAVLHKYKAPHDVELNDRLKELVRVARPDLEEVWGGGWAVDKLVDKYHARKARMQLLSIGLDGLYEEVAGGIEVAVYNPAVIKVLKSEKIG